MKNSKSYPFQITSRGRFTLEAMINLALRGSDEKPVPLSDIAQSIKVSTSYLEQLFSGLRHSGLVKSYRGPGGGYILAKPPGYIKMNEILQATHGLARSKRSDNQKKSNSHADALWQHIGEVLDERFDEISLKDIIERNY